MTSDSTSASTLLTLSDTNKNFPFTERRKRLLLRPPTLLYYGVPQDDNSTSQVIQLFEFSIHNCPKLMQKEVEKLFPDKFNNTTIQNVKIVIFFQHANLDLVTIGAEVEDEKNRCLKNFLSLGEALIKLIPNEENSLENWIDYTDPCSGIPVHHKSRTTLCWSDLEAIQMLLGYHTFQAGNCQVMSHPIWRTYCYPTTLFTTLSEPTLIKIFEQLQREKEMC